jgi:redox-sensitive bicupin YhaK (pirin superfamily)
MKTELFKAETRGHADHGWLKANHSFSFANYYNPDRMGFGVLRVLNDDFIAPDKGFGTHPHDNMEIISIPISGSLKHEDSMGNGSIITAGEIQVMSAGTGIFHSEHNPSSSEPTNLFQIWVVPNKTGVEPRYDQLTIKDISTPNKLFQILSPNSEDQGVWIHQDAWFSMGNYSESITETYNLKGKQHGLFLMVISGSVTIDGITLNRRDGISIIDTKEITFSVEPGTDLLLMELPINE